MGTNYYVKLPFEDGCHVEEHRKVLHIGKSSSGWAFGFHGYPERDYETWQPVITSWADWQELLQQEGVVIYNEYNDEMEFEEFRLLVEAKQSNPDYVERSRLQQRNYPSPRSWMDLQGYDFYDGEFF